MPNETTPALRLLNRKQLRELVPVADSTIWRWENAGLFPPGMIVGGGRRFWSEDQVRTWLENRLRESLERSAGASTLHGQEDQP